MFGFFNGNSNSEANADKTPIFKSKRFSHDGNIKLELIADNVATFEIDGKEEIADLTLWQKRIDTIFGTVENSLKKYTSKYCTPPDSVEIYFQS